jgi:hypothetical protein
MLMHPGTGGTDLGTGTANIGASIAYPAPTTGYLLTLASGLFCSRIVRLRVRVRN